MTKADCLKGMLKLVDFLRMKGYCDGTSALDRDIWKFIKKFKREKEI